MKRNEALEWNTFVKMDLIFSYVSTKCLFAIRPHNDIKDLSWSHSKSCRPSWRTCSWWVWSVAKREHLLGHYATSVLCWLCFKQAIVDEYGIGEVFLGKNLFFSSKWKKHLPNKNCNITKYLYFNKTKRSFNHSINFLAVYICFYLQKIRSQKKESFLPRFKILEYKTAPKILRKMQASADLQK